jgi:uncharacterized membrane protein
MEYPVPQSSLNPKGATVSDPSSYQPPPPPPPQYQAPPPPPPQFQAPAPASSGLTDNAASGLAYVTIIPAIIFLIVEPYNKSPNVRFHSWQSIFLAITWFAVDVVLMIIGRIPFVGWVTWMLFPLVGLGFFILWLVVLFNAFNGKRFSVPFIGDLAAKQAGG